MSCCADSLRLSISNRPLFLTDSGFSSRFLPWTDPCSQQDYPSLDILALTKSHGSEPAGCFVRLSPAGCRHLTSRRGPIAAAWGSAVPALLDSADGRSPPQLWALAQLPDGGETLYGLERGRALPAAPANIVLAACCPGAARWAAVTDDGRLHVVARSGSVVAAEPRLAHDAVDLAWTPCAAALLVLAADGSVHLYDPALHALSPLDDVRLGTSVLRQGRGTATTSRVERTVPAPPQGTLRLVVLARGHGYVVWDSERVDEAHVVSVVARSASDHDWVQLDSVATLVNTYLL